MHPPLSDLKCEHQAFYTKFRGLCCIKRVPEIKKCDAIGKERSCPDMERLGSSTFILPHSLTELDGMLEEIESSKLERMDWLVDRLYHELNEQPEVLK